MNTKLGGAVESLRGRGPAEGPQQVEELDNH